MDSILPAAELKGTLQQENELLEDMEFYKSITIMNHIKDLYFYRVSTIKLVSYHELYHYRVFTIKLLSYHELYHVRQPTTPRHVFRNFLLRPKQRRIRNSTWVSISKTRHNGGVMENQSI